MIDAKRKAFIFLTIAFILAVVAAGFIINQIQMAQESLGETIQVAAADQDIQSYTAVDESDIKWVEMPKTAQVDSFIQKTDDLSDSITIVNLEEGELVTKSVLRKKIDIPADHRVVWLNPGENVLVDQNVADGDLVDIISVMENKEKGVSTERLLQNVKVVQIDEQKEGPPAIKVSLSVADAEKLIFTQNAAKQIRVLRVNQVPSTNQETTPPAEPEPKEEKPAEPKPEDAAKKDAEKAEPKEETKKEQ